MDATLKKILIFVTILAALTVLTGAAMAAPTVNVTYPDGGTVNDTITLNATATDSYGNITNVTFYHATSPSDNGTIIGTNSTLNAPYYTYPWDTASVSDGTYYIRAVAMNETGVSGEDYSPSFTVENVNDAPTVTDPVVSGGSSGNITFSTDVTDDRNSIASVQFYIYNTSGLVDSGNYNWNNTTTYQLQDWDSTAVSDGNYSVQAEATDTGGKSNKSNNVTFTVDNVNDPPTVNVTNPTSSGSPYNGTITLKANARDDRGIDTVSFYLYNGSTWTFLGNHTGQSGDTYERTWDSMSVSDGTYKIRARATDTDGASTNSSNESFTTDNYNVPPTITNVQVSPLSGVAPVTFTFNATYTDQDGEFNYIRVVIDSNTYSMNESDPSDSNVTDGKDYYGKVTLDTAGAPTAKTYTPKIKASDGKTTRENNTQQITVYPATYYQGNRVWDERSMNTTYRWTPESFAGFYYDLDTGVGTENLTIKNIDRNLGQGDIIYNTTPSSQSFERSGWGEYKVVGWMGEKYFAGYTNGALDGQASSADNLLEEGLLSKVLKDDDKDRTLSMGQSIALDEGYQLILQDISTEGDSIYVRLFRDGEEVDSEAIDLGNTHTYVYEKDLGGVEVPVIAVYFERAFRGTETNLAKIGGVFQVSTDVLEVSDGDTYGEMKVEYVGSDEIRLENEEEVSLDRGDNVSLMGDISIHVADNSTLRFAPFLKNLEPDAVRRGTVCEEETEFTWWPYNFEGFYYDIDSDVYTEKLTITRSSSTDETISEGDLTYTTRPKSQSFEYSGWGEYKVVGWMAEKYFAGYNGASFTADKSLLDGDCLSRVLKEDDRKRTLALGQEFVLAEDYTLIARDIDVDGDTVALTLRKNGVEVDTQFLNAGEDFVYEKDIGGVSDVPIIVVHVEGAFSGTETNLAILKGVFQISTQVEEIDTGDTYGKMEVEDVDSNGIEMDNEDSITLSEGAMIPLMGNIGVMVGDDTTVRFAPYVVGSAVSKPLSISVPSVVTVGEEVTIKVKSEGESVEGVQVSVAGVSIGTTDSSGEITYTPDLEGTYSVVAERGGYETATESFKASSKALSIKTPDQILVGEDIGVEVRSEGERVEGVDMYLDGSLVGTTDSDGRVVFAPSEAGSHTLQARKPGYTTTSVTIDVLRPASYEVSRIDWTGENKTGETMRFTANVSNTGDIGGTYTAVFKVDGQEISNKTVMVSAGGEQEVSFDHVFEEKGLHSVSIGDQRLEVNVESSLPPTPVLVGGAAAIVAAGIGGLMYVKGWGFAELARGLQGITGRVREIIEGYRRKRL